MHSRAEVRAFYRDFVFQKRDVYAVGEPLEGFMALNRDAPQITAIYARHPGNGVGKSLMDHAKQGRDALFLWTYQNNEGARSFYVREGFCEVEQTDGLDSDAGLPEVRMEWRRSP